MVAACLVSGAVAQNPPATPDPIPRVPAVFRARGIHHFPGRVRCPLAGVGTRGPHASNRLVLEDEHSRVVVDWAARRIVFANTQPYPRKAPVGEFLFLGTGVTEAGTQAPFAIHLKIAKHRAEFDAQTHIHPTVREKLVSADFEPFEVVVSSGRTEETVLTRESALKSVREPRLTARLANIFLEVKDNLEGVKQDASKPEFRLADISVGLGEGRFSKMVLRAQLVSLDRANRPLILRRSLPEMFRAGAWELRLTALSSLLPKEDFARDLFLIGLDRLPLLEGVMRNGLKKGETLGFRLRDGKGTIRLGNNSQEIPDAAGVSRAYLEFNFLGAILARQVTHPVSGARQ